MNTEALPPGLKQPKTPAPEGPEIAAPENQSLPSNWRRPNSIGETLKREDLLEAVDYEIHQREGASSRHGASMWGVSGASILLLWMTVNEALNGLHVLLNVALVAFAAHWVLNWLLGHWGKAFFSPMKATLIPGRKLSVTQISQQLGFDPTQLRFLVLEITGLSALTLYLAWHGFVQLAIAALPVYAVALILLLLVGALSKLQLPFFEFPSTPARRSRISVVIAYFLKLSLYLWAALFFFWLCTALADSAPGLSSGDIRLGILASGTWVVSGLAVRMTKTDAGLDSLRGIRFRLGFGLIAVDRARLEIEEALYGSPQEAYLRSKAEEIIAQCAQCIDISTRACAILKRWTELSGTASALQNDPKTAKNIASEFRPSFYRLQSLLKAFEANRKRLKDLINDLETRIDAARWVLDIDPVSIQQLRSRVTIALNETDLAGREFVALRDRSTAALDFLFAYQRNIKLPKQNGRKILRLLFLK